MFEFSVTGEFGQHFVCRERIKEDHTRHLQFDESALCLVLLSGCTGWPPSRRSRHSRRSLAPRFHF